jgi:hypothetical protein
MNCNDPVLRGNALRLVVAAFVIAPSASALAADCELWNVAGQWNAVQSNSGGNTDPLLSLQQDGTAFKGSASYVTPNHVTVQGPVVGTVRGSAFEATIYWRGRENQVGVYSGQIGPQGLVVGRTFDKNHPATRADWHADHAFDCRTADAAANAGNNGNSGNGTSGQPAMTLGRTYAPGPASQNASHVPGTANQPRQTRGVPAPDSGLLTRSTVATPLATPQLARQQAELAAPRLQSAASAASPSPAPAPGAFR